MLCIIIKGELWSSHTLNPSQVCVYAWTTLEVADCWLVRGKCKQTRLFRCKLNCVPAKILKLRTADRPMGCKGAFCNCAPFHSSFSCERVNFWPFSRWATAHSRGGIWLPNPPLLQFLPFLKGWSHRSSLIFQNSKYPCCSGKALHTTLGMIWNRYKDPADDAEFSTKCEVLGLVWP